MRPHDAPIPRFDEVGRPISLGARWTQRSAVLFTGAPGLGVSAQLDDIRHRAEAAGALVLRIKATSTEPIEHRFAREVKDRLGSWLGTPSKSSAHWRNGRDWRGFRLTQRLKAKARALNRSVEDKGLVRGIRTPSGPGGLLAQAEIDTGKARLRPPATLNDLADAAQEVARHKGVGPAIIVIDDVHRATPRDLAVINELAEHLEATNRESGQQVVLVMGGREDALDGLREASKGANGAANEVARVYDTRPCRPFTEPELFQLLAQRLDRTVPSHFRDLYCHPVHQHAMVREAHGNAGRLAEIIDNAVRESGYGRFAVTGDMVHRAVRIVDADRERAYTSIWNGCDPAEREVMVLVALEDERGLDVGAFATRPGPDIAAWPEQDLARWARFDTARQRLDMQHGVMDMTADNQRLIFSDPGMRDFVVRHNPGLIPQPAQHTPYQPAPYLPAAQHRLPYQQTPYQPASPMQPPGPYAPAPDRQPQPPLTPDMIPGHPRSGVAPPFRPAPGPGGPPAGRPNAVAAARVYVMPPAGPPRREGPGS